MRTIYAPTGRALEYAELALNLYVGCEHGCTYCYSPACMHMSREFFREHVRPRDGILKALEHDLPKFKGDKRVVHLCFTCDPYTPIEKHWKLTRSAIELIGDAGLKMRVLTKNGGLALRDLDLFKKYGVEFGETVVFSSESDREAYEPGAVALAERLQAMSAAHMIGIRTWVSIEPIFSIEDAIIVLRRFELCADTFKLGKINYDKEAEARVDWRQGLRRILVELSLMRNAYYIKNDFWAFADDEIKATWPKERTDARTV